MTVLKESYFATVPGHQEISSKVLTPRRSNPRNTWYSGNTTITTWNLHTETHQLWALELGNDRDAERSTRTIFSIGEDGLWGLHDHCSPLGLTVMVSVKKHHVIEQLVANLCTMTFQQPYLNNDISMGQKCAVGTASVRL